jgi:hypothetical protein
VTQSQAQAVLADAFRSLRPRQKARLLEHERRGTPILCGSSGDEFSRRSDGAGSPETLAATRHVPRCCDFGVRNARYRWNQILDRFFDAVGDVYLGALYEATPETVRAAIRQACRPVAPVGE